MNELWYAIFHWASIALIGVIAIETVILIILGIKVLQHGKRSKKDTLLSVGAGAAVMAFPVSLLISCIILLVEAIVLLWVIFRTYRFLNPKEPEPEPVAVAEPDPEVIPEPEPEPEPEIEIEELIRDTITIEEAHDALTDAEASHLIEVEDDEEELKAEPIRYSQKTIINVDTLSDHFENNSHVTLDALKEKKLVPQNTDFVKVLGRGILNKHLIVELQDYSADAVKMIVLTGGHAIQKH